MRRRTRKRVWIGVLTIGGEWTGQLDHSECKEAEQQSCCLLPAVVRVLLRLMEDTLLHLGGQGVVP